MEQTLRCSGCAQPRDEAWILPDDPPDVVDAKYERYGARIIKCMGCAARDAQSRDYEQSAQTGPDGKKLLDRDGIFFPVVER
jgi:hypothetical protein